ncbi:hypothetical protein Tdes44962_MAKER02831 [Teratosphaeria destructans]|uniref:Uncharacterized protein n=1 Tax=Teratosphaeria destructans TaxID=418781 RepID=A0A9W7W271_9PEZI|nr:hypothetical protein Tdes44962_MAKER02831 [Teratosphaeria destructans]
MHGVLLTSHEPLTCSVEESWERRQGLEATETLQPGPYYYYHHYYSLPAARARNGNLERLRVPACSDNAATSMLLRWDGELWGAWPVNPRDFVYGLGEVRPHKRRFLGTRDGRVGKQHETHAARDETRDDRALQPKVTWKVS